MRAGLTLMLAGLLGSGAAAPVISGTVNLSPVPAEADLPCLTFTGAGPAALPAARPAPVSADLAEAQQELAGLEAELKTLTPGSAEYTQMKGALDMARSALGTAAPSPTAAAGKSQVYRQLTAKQAVGNLYVSLAYRVSPKGWQNFLNAGGLADPGKARAAAAAAVVRGRPLAAVAAYLRVLEKRPKDADALYNLGALAAFLNAPNEALALLAASEANGGPTGSFYPARTQLLTTRGYALMGVGRSADAEKVLREAVKLAPLFSEANRNLAAALGNQKKCAEAKTALGRAFRRSDAAVKASTATADSEGALSPQSGVPVQPIPGSAPGEQIRLVRDTLDFRRGTVGRWPYFPVAVEPEEKGKLERMIADYEAWTERNGVTEAMFQKNYDATFESSNYIVQLATSNSPSRARSYLLWESVRQLYFYPRPSYRAAAVQQQAHTAYFQGELNSGEALGRKVQNSKDLRSEAEKSCKGAKDNLYCFKKAEYEDMTRQCLAVRTWNNLWRGSISSLETPTRAQVAELDRYFTTVLSYIAEPRLYRYPQAHYTLLRHQQMNWVPLAIAAHLNELRRLQDPCVYLANTPPPSPNEALGAYEELSVLPCQPSATYKAKALVFEASMNCEKVGFELSAEIPYLDVGVYINVEEKFSAGAQKPPTPKDTFLTSQGIVNPERIPKFGESGDSTVSTFGAGVGVKVGVGAAGNGLEGKAGFYVSGDGKGNLGDVGAKVESSATVGGEVDVGIGEIGVGVEFEGPGASVSFVPSVGDR